MVRISGFEDRCRKIVKDLQSMAGAKYIDSDEAFKELPDYRTRVPRPLSLETVRKNLAEGGYQYLNDFATDVRTIAGNFVRFNYFALSAEVKLRRDVCRLLFKFEQQWLELQYEVARALISENSDMEFNFQQPMEALRYFLCAFEETVKVPSIANDAASDGKGAVSQYAIDSFINPIHFYLTPDDLKRYLAVIEKPMCWADIVSNAIEARYATIQELETDASLIVANCAKFWNLKQNRDTPNAKNFIKDAEALYERFHHVLWHPPDKNLYGVVLDYMPRFDPRSVGDGRTGKKGKTPSKKASARSQSGGSDTTEVSKRGDSRNKEKNPTFPNLIVDSSSSGGRKKSEGSTNKESMEETANGSNELELLSLDQLRQRGMNSNALTNLVKKIDQLIKTVLRLCLNKVKSHEINWNGNRLNSASIFLKAVDPTVVKDYASVISNPIDLGRIEKNLNHDKYTSSGQGNSCSTAINAILDHIKLLRDNAHTYNTGDSGKPYRMMADGVALYFRYLVRNLLKLLRSRGDPQLLGVVFHQLYYGDTKENASNAAAFMEEEDDKGILQFVAESGKSAESILSEVANAELKNLGLTVNNSKKPNSNSVSLIRQDVAVTKKASKVNGRSSGTVKNVSKLTGKGSVQTHAGVATDDMGFIAPAAPAAFEFLDPAISKDAAGFIEPAVPKNVFSVGTSRLVGAARFYQGSTRPKIGWECGAEEVLDKIMRHDFVDYRKEKTAIADFWNPVVETHPAIAEAYLQVIREPIELSTIYANLEQGGGAIPNADEFSRQMKLVFDNAVTFCEPHQQLPEEAFLLKRYKHLGKFVYWLCLEHLPVDTEESVQQSKKGDEQGISSSEGKILTIFNRDTERKFRESVIQDAAIDDINGKRTCPECLRLLKDLEKAGKAEKLPMAYFIQPVDEAQLSDYSIFVRRKSDFSSIRFRLTGELPADYASKSLVLKRQHEQCSYKTYGEFLSDVRLMFTNAIKYNSVYMEKDKLSRTVHDGAKLLLIKLEELVPLFTVALMDRINRNEIKAEEHTQQEMERLAREEKAREDALALEEEVKQQLIAKDKSFAQFYGPKNGTSQEYSPDHSSMEPQQSPLVISAGGILATIQQAKRSLVYGFGASGRVPDVFSSKIERKLAVLERVWRDRPATKRSYPSGEEKKTSSGATDELLAERSVADIPLKGNSNEERDHATAIKQRWEEVAFPAGSMRDISSVDISQSTNLENRGTKRMRFAISTSVRAASRNIVPRLCDVFVESDHAS